MNALEALHKWSCETPNKNVWTFLNDKGDITESYTYKVSVYFPDLYIFPHLPWNKAKSQYSTWVYTLKHENYS